MSNRLTSLSTAFFTLGAMAAVGLACSASTSRAEIADILKMLPRGEVSRAATSRQLLPAISNPRPLRQGLFVNCNVDTPIGADTCVMAFDLVPAGRLLQIDRVDCVVGTGLGAIIFNTEIAVNGGRLMGVVQTPYVGSPSSTASGPYYFRALERPIVASSGGSGEKAICTIAGTLWQTN
jgi:hypothetical protein